MDTTMNKGVNTTETSTGQRFQISINDLDKRIERYRHEAGQDRRCGILFIVLMALTVVFTAFFRATYFDGGENLMQEVVGQIILMLLLIGIIMFTIAGYIGIRNWMGMRGRIEELREWRRQARNLAKIFYPATTTADDHDPITQTEQDTEIATPTQAVN